MTEYALCLRCRHVNPPGNRFCGSCGASLEISSEFVPRREVGLTVAGRTLPAKLIPAARALALGLGALAAEVELS